MLSVLSRPVGLGTELAFETEQLTCCEIRLMWELRDFLPEFQQYLKNPRCRVKLT
jgi:hypothetical protein